MERLDAIDARSRAQRPAPTPDELRAIVRDELAREREAIAREAAALERLRRAEAARAGSAGQPTAAVGQGVHGGTLYSGATFAGGVQALLGARLDFGELTPAVRGLRLVPEVAFGFGSGATSTYVAANALYEFGAVSTSIGRVRPRAMLGAGLLNFSDRVRDRDGLDAVLTPAYGVALELPALRALGGGAGAPDLVVEHQGVGLFDVNRLVVGVRWRR